ncbi:hypothetical protein ABK040_016491 [Willaertia magna]
MQKQLFSIKPSKSSVALVGNKGNSNNSSIAAGSIVRSNVSLKPQETKAKTKYDSLKNAAERLLSARSQHKVSLENKSKLLSQTEQCLKNLEDVVSDLSKAKVKLEAMNQTEETRIEKLKLGSEATEKAVQGVKVLLSDVLEKKKFALDVVNSFKDALLYDQKQYEIYLDNFHKLQENNSYLDDQLKRASNQRNTKEQTKLSIEREIIEINNNINALEAEEGQTRNRLLTAQNDIEKEEMSVNNYIQMNENSKKVLDELFSSEQRLVSQIETLQLNVEQITNQINLTYSDVNEVENLINSFRESSNALHFKDGFERLKLKGSSEVNNLDCNKIVYLTQQITKSNKELNKLKELLESSVKVNQSLESNIESISSKLQDKDKELALEEEKVRNTLATKEAVFGEYENQLREISEMKVKIDSRNQHLQQNNAEIFVAENRCQIAIQELQDKCDKANEGLVNKQQTLEHKKRKVEHLNKSIEETARLGQEADNKLVETDVYLQQLDSALIDADKEIEISENELRQRENNLVLLRENHKNIQKEIEEGKSTINSDSMSGLMDESYGNMLDSLNTTIKTLARKIERLGEGESFEEISTPTSTSKKLEFNSASSTRSNNGVGNNSDFPFSIDFADDLFTDSESKRDNFDFFDEEF